MTESCPTCGTTMNHNGTSGHDALGRLQEVSWCECPNCETIVGDTGDVMTKMEQLHGKAWAEYANSEDDWSLIPDYV